MYNKKVTFRSFISKFFAKKERDKDGNVLSLYKTFNKPQLIGAIIRTSKKAGYRVISKMNDSFEQKVVKLNFR